MSASEKFIPVVFMAAMVFWFVRNLQNSNNRAMSFGKSRARLQGDGGKRTTFEDVAGIDESKEELQEAYDDVLATDRYLDAVRADEAEARELQVSGVPFFVIDGRLAVAGAQPPEVLLEVLQRAWTEREPELEVIDGGEACGPDDCEI
jgi:hypothetical protein